MWDFKYRKNKKVVEARAGYGGADLLLTVGPYSTRLAMNGGVLIKNHEFDNFVNDLGEAVVTARKILEAQ